MSTSRDTGGGTIKTFDPVNLGIAVEILLLCALELEICLGYCRQTSEKLLSGKGVKEHSVKRKWCIKNLYTIEALLR